MKQTTNLKKLYVIATETLAKSTNYQALSFTKIISEKWEIIRGEKNIHKV